MPTVYESFPGKEKTKLDDLVNFIQTSSSGDICGSKTGRKGVIIPKNHTDAVICRAGEFRSCGQANPGII